MKDVLLITIDSLRADHVGCFGYDRDTTPVIDEFAADGHTFERTFAHACSTRPSFPSIMSSSHALMHGGFEMMTEGRTMVAEVFDDGGYQTAGFHSNLYLSADFGYDRGFDFFYDSKTDPGTTARIRQFVKDRLDQDGLLYKLLASAFDTAERTAGINVGSAYDTATEITDNALEWVETADEGGPRFLWVHYMDVHHPYVPPAEYQREFRDDPISENRSIKLRRKMIEEPENVTDSELEEIVDLYDAEIKYTDAEIGRLIEEVTEAWGEEPVTAITADHGEEFLDHGQFSHYTHFYDEVMQVPLFLGGIEGSGRYDELVGLQDVPATLVDYAGLEVPDAFQGWSVRPIVEGGDWPRTHVIGDWSDRQGENRFGYRDEEWKFVRRDSGEELYDLEADPDENRNVIDDHPEVAERLGETIDDHVRAIDETGSDLVEVEMDEDVKARLRDLGYKE
ncbi:sulfatase [Halorientalis halophila]|uniref:sulfatase n=1 Tax=Halorientalis halophila TaxID=3108499 RepID=UPI0030091859